MGNLSQLIGYTQCFALQPSKIYATVMGKRKENENQLKRGKCRKPFSELCNSTRHHSQRSPLFILYFSLPTFRFSVFLSTTSLKVQFQWEHNPSSDASLRLVRAARNSLLSDRHLSAISSRSQWALPGMNRANHSSLAEIR